MQLKVSILFSFWVIFISACNNNSGTEKTGVKDTLQTTNQLSELEQKLNQSPNSDSLREGFIQELVLQQQYDKALSQIDILLQKDTASPAYLFMKADALEKKGDTSNAIAFFEKSIVSAGKFVEAEARVAMLYAETGNKNALVVCAALLKDPTAIQMRSDLLFIEAIYYNKIKDTKKAISIYDQLIREDYTYLDAYIEKGLVYYDQGNFAAAFTSFERSTNVSNKYADGYFWMAKAQEKLHQQQEAIDNYKRALALDQTITEAREALKRLGAIK